MRKTSECEHLRAVYDFRDGTTRCGHYQSEWAPGFGYDEDKGEIVRAKCDRCLSLLPLGPSNDDPPEVRVDVAAGRMIAAARGLRETESFYFHDDGAMAITTGDQDGAYAWDISRPLAEQLDETAADDAAADALEHSGCPMDCPACTAMCNAMIDRFNEQAKDAMEYELTRAAEPDCRDEDGPEVERIMAEMERVPGPAVKRYLDHAADAACRRIPTLDETLDRQAGVMRALAEMERREHASGGDMLTAEEAAECAVSSGSDVCQACGNKWTVHGQTCSGSVTEVNRG